VGVFGGFVMSDDVEVEGYDIDLDDTAFASQFIAGVNFEIAPNLSADLAYKYFYSEYEFDGADTEAGSHIFQVGLNFHF
jgi:opacity protein-like surface antigen